MRHQWQRGETWYQSWIMTPLLMNFLYLTISVYCATRRKRLKFRNTSEDLVSSRNSYKKKKKKKKGKEMQTRRLMGLYEKIYPFTNICRPTCIIDSAFHCKSSQVYFTI